MAAGEALTIGGGVAGAAAAIHLAQAGCRVRLLERQSGPHDKVCGEFISSEAVAMLRRLGLDPETLGGLPIDRLRISSGGRTAEMQLPFAAFSLPRRRLDEALLARAVAAGAVVERAAHVVACERSDGRWQARLADGRVLAAESLLLATGKHELRGLERPVRHARDPWIGLRFAGTRVDSASLDGRIEMIFFDGGYGGIEASGDGGVHFSLAVRKSRLLAANKDPQALLAGIGSRDPGFAARLKAFRDRPLAIADIPYGFLHRSRPSDPPALFRLGDQFAVIPSFCGDGMAIALHSARLCAGYLTARDASGYHRRLRADLGPQFRHAAFLAGLADSAFGRRLLVATASRAPALVAFAARQTRVRAPS